MFNAFFLQCCRKNHCLKAPLFKKAEQVYFVSNNAMVKKSQFFKTTEVNIRKRLVYKMISEITSPEKQNISLGRCFKTPWHLTQNFFLLNMNFIDFKTYYNAWNFINPFSTNVPHLYPLQISENQRSSDVFRGHRSRTLVENGLNEYTFGRYVATI